MSGAEFQQWALGIATILAPIMGAGAWVSNCILQKRAMRRSTAQHESTRAALNGSTPEDPKKL